jgi:hypothetical protein
MLKYLSIACLLAISALTMTSCKKDKNDDPSPGVTHKVQFKAETSQDARIYNATYGVDADVHIAQDLNGTSWTSPELTAPAGAYNANIVLNAIGTTDNSTLKVTVYIDGEPKKSQSAGPGKGLTVNLGYKF